MIDVGTELYVVLVMDPAEIVCPLVTVFRPMDEAERFAAKECKPRDVDRDFLPIRRRVGVAGRVPNAGRVKFQPAMCILKAKFIDRPVSDSPGVSDDPIHVSEILPRSAGEGVLPEHLVLP